MTLMIRQFAELAMNIFCDLDLRDEPPLSWYFDRLVQGLNAPFRSEDWKALERLFHRPLWT